MGEFGSLPRDARRGKLTQAESDEDSSEEDESDSDADTSDIPDGAVGFAEDAIQIGGDDGEMSLDELDEYLNDTRGYDVDPEAVAQANDNLEVDGDTVRIA